MEMWEAPSTQRSVQGSPSGLGMLVDVKIKIIIIEKKSAQSALFKYAKGGLEGMEILEFLRKLECMLLNYNFKSN